MNSLKSLSRVERKFFISIKDKLFLFKFKIKNS